VVLIAERHLDTLLSVIFSNIKDIQNRKASALKRDILYVRYIPYFFA